MLVRHRGLNTLKVNRRKHTHANNSKVRTFVTLLMSEKNQHSDKNYSRTQKRYFIIKCSNYQKDRIIINKYAPKNRFSKIHEVKHNQ
jgi:hypothetical protein